MKRGSGKVAAKLNFSARVHNKREFQFAAASARCWFPPDFSRIYQHLNRMLFLKKSFHFWKFFKIIVLIWNYYCMNTFTFFVVYPFQDVLIKLLALQ